LKYAKVKITQMEYKVEDKKQSAGYLLCDFSKKIEKIDII
jgi:hypothetical protein